MAAEDPCLPVRRARDGSTWRIGTDAEVAWIADGTSMGRTITAAIPPFFGAYATVRLPDGDEEQEKHDRAVSALLSGTLGMACSATCASRPQGRCSNRT